MKIYFPTITLIFSIIVIVYSNFYLKLQMLSIFENIRRIIFEIKIKLNVSASPLGDPMVHKVINVTDDAIMFKIFCTIPLNSMAHIMA